MKFPYIKFLLSVRSSYFGSSILKPIIPIKITVGSLTVRYGALIDSGADFCIFDVGIGEYLGIDIETGIKTSFGGIQERGGAVAYIHSVFLDIGGNSYKTTIGFSRDIAKYGYGILGQKGFFNLFKVKFDYRKAEIEITPKININ